MSIMVRGVSVMTRQVIATFGTKDVLTQYLKREPKRHLLLLQPVAADADFQLLDLSDRTTFFNSPFTYQIRYHFGQKTLTGFFNFTYLTFATPDKAKVFTTNFADLSVNSHRFIGLNQLFLLKLDAPQIEYIIFSSWQRDVDFFNWRKSKDFQTLKPYMHAGENVQQLHQANYTIPEKD